MTAKTFTTYRTGRPGIYKKQTAGLSRVKVIEWYFYPEFANKKLFKRHKHANVGLRQITGKRYEELSHTGWTESSRDGDGGASRSIGQS